MKKEDAYELDFTHDPLLIANAIAKKLYNEKSSAHRIIFIDEIDNLIRSTSHKRFVEFLYTIIKYSTNTSIIGIANSVDLIQNLQNRSKKERDLIQS